MHVVAITRMGRALDAELPVLAEWLGMTAYDLRLRINAGLPAIVATMPDSAQANALCARLRERGHGAVSADLAFVQALAPQVVREPSLAGDVFRGTDTQGQPFEMRMPNVLSVLRATSVQEDESSVTTHEKKLSVGRAVLSGGLMLRKTETRTTETQAETREQVLYVFRIDTRVPLLLRELSLRYQMLGKDLKPTTAQNFATLIEKLRAGAPQALYDQRMFTQKRKVVMSVASGTADVRRVSSSNESENLLAGYLITLAHVERQL
jgi:hypothetical protein